MSDDADKPLRQPLEPEDERVRAAEALARSVSYRERHCGQFRAVASPTPYIGLTGVSRKCPKCGKHRDVNTWPKDRSRPDGRAYACGVCRKAKDHGRKRSGKKARSQLRIQLPVELATWLRGYARKRNDTPGGIVEDLVRELKLTRAPQTNDDENRS